MGTGLIYDERFLDHETGQGHPEQPRRLKAIMDRLASRHVLDRLVRLPFGPADLKWIEALHDPAYVRRIFAACEAGESWFSERDMSISPLSAEVAQLATGGVLAACDAVMAGDVDNAFCATRPPGHHAEHDTAMGFCIFSHVAIAANYLIEHHGLERVAIIDWDVHHGNGTQHLLEDRGDVLFISIHEHPTYLYPGTGYVHERGTGAGQGLTINIPFDPRQTDAEYRHAMVFKVMPALEKFKPQFILISAGFDASCDDPLAHMEVTPRGFLWMTRFLKRQAERDCDGRLVSVLEGGYDLRSLAECTEMHVRGLMESDEHPVEDMKSGF